jgi:stage V sporulation protein B
VILRLRERPPTGRRIPVAERLMDTALPLAVADDLKTGINTVENLMVPKRLALCTLVESPLAAFGVVSGMVFPVLMFPSCILFALAELLIPELARCAAAGSRRRIEYLSKRSLKVALLYGMVFCGLEYLTADSLCLRRNCEKSLSVIKRQTTRWEKRKQPLSKKSLIARMWQSGTMRN